MMKKICLLLFLTLPVPMPEAATEESLFSEAENHYRAGNYLLALDAYAEFADRYPLSDRVPDAQYRRALCHINLQHNNEALIILKQIEKRYRSTRYLDYIYFWQGIAHYRLENYSESIDAFTVFLGRVKDSELVPQSLLHKGLAEIALAHYSGAAATLERLNEAYFASPQGPYGLILLLYVYLNTEAFDQILNTTARLQEEDLPEKWRDRYKLYRAEARNFIWNYLKASNIPLGVDKVGVLNSLTKQPDHLYPHGGKPIFHMKPLDMGRLFQVASSQPLHLAIEPLRLYRL
ncbi:Cell division coordinator CpoB [subsurface metagenome]